MRQYPEGAAEFVDKNGETFNVGLSNPLGMVQILTTVTPPLDPPQSLPAVSSGMFFMPRVGDANFPFKIVATDVENNVLEFEAPLVFVERDHNVVDGKLEAARNTYNTHALVDREFDLKGQKVAYADSVKPDDTMLSTSSLTFNVAIPIGISGSQDEPRFVPVLDEAQVVVPAMSALTGDAAPQRVKYQKHYAKQGFASNAVEAFLEFPTPPGMKFAGKGDRSGGFVMLLLLRSGSSSFYHDLAREVLDIDFRWRNFPGYRELYRQMVAHLYKRLFQASYMEQQRMWFDILYLARHNPYMRPYYDWKALGGAYAQATTAEDIPAILAMVERHEGSAHAQIAAYWWGRQPRAFLTYRSGDEIVGFLVHLALHEATAEAIGGCYALYLVQFRSVGGSRSLPQITLPARRGLIANAALRSRKYRLTARLHSLTDP